MSKNNNKIETEELASYFKELSHPIRIKILKHLQKIDKCICGEIVNIFPLSQSTVSQHLKFLKDGGLIQGEIKGPRTSYCINNHVLKQFKEAVKDL